MDHLESEETKKTTTKEVFLDGVAYVTFKEASRMLCLSIPRARTHLARLGVTSVLKHPHSLYKKSEVEAAMSKRKNVIKTLADCEKEYQEKMAEIRDRLNKSKQEEN